jgi:hypothetical protein
MAATIQKNPVSSHQNSIIICRQFNRLFPDVGNFFAEIFDDHFAQPALPHVNPVGRPTARD